MVLEPVEYFKNVILANGEYPSAHIPTEILSNAAYVVCCDGAANEYIARGFTPDIIIGDGDSLNEDNSRRFASILHRITEQETNDQTKAVHFLLSQKMYEIAIVGATGKREDHTLGNISLLIEYARAGAQIRTYTEYGVFIPCKGKCSLHTRPGQQISIFNFTARRLTSQGLRYPIYGFDNWWQGTLNCSTCNKVEIDADGEYIIFVNY